MSREDAPADPEGPRDALSEAWYRDRSVAELHAEAAAREGDDRRARRRVLRVALAVLLLLAGVDVLLRRVRPPTELIRSMPDGLGVYYAKLHALERVEPPDVLFLGSSRMARALVPDVLERRLAERQGLELGAFNLGLNNAKLEELSAVVRNHLPEPPPRWVVIGFSGTELVNTHAFQYASRFLWSTGDALAWWRRTPWEELDAEHLARFAERLLGRVWYLYDQHSALRREIERWWEGVTGEHDARRLAGQARRKQLADGMVASDDGYWPDSPFDTAGDLAQRLARDPEGVRVPPRELEFPEELVHGSRFPLLRDVVRRLRARGCRVALVEVPPSPWLAAKNPLLHGDGLPPTPQRPEGVPGARARLAELAAELDLPFVPMDAAELGLTDADFVDANHMGRSGAVQYTRALAERLVDAGFLEPAR